MDSNPQQNAKTSTSLKQQSLTTTGNQPESPPMKSSEDTSTSMSATTPDASEPGQKGYVFHGGRLLEMVRDWERKDPEGWKRCASRGTGSCTRCARSPSGVKHGLTQTGAANGDRGFVRP